jgi:hypothetical protein
MAKLVMNGEKQALLGYSVEERYYPHKLPQTILHLFVQKFFVMGR